jgi:hypothetical protein
MSSGNTSGKSQTIGRESTRTKFLTLLIQTIKYFGPISYLGKLGKSGVEIYNIFTFSLALIIIIIILGIL